MSHKKYKTFSKIFNMILYKNVLKFIVVEYYYNDKIKTNIKEIYYGELYLYSLWLHL